jgi:hypothetical protein
MTIPVDASEWRLTTDDGIPYRLVSSNGVFTEEDATAQEVIIIKAHQLGQFVQEAIPPPFSAINAVFYPQRRLMPGTPLQTKRISWKSNVEGKPVDPFLQDTDAGSNTYEGDLELTIDYGTHPSNDSDSDPDDPRTYLEITGNASGNFLVCNVGGDAQWEAQGDLPLETITNNDLPHYVPQPEIEWTCIWSQIPSHFFEDTLRTRLNQALGRVNSAVMPLFWNAPIETILFIGWSVKLQYSWRSDMGGQAPLRLELKFLEKNFKAIDADNEIVQVTHNHYYTSEKGWRRMLVRGEPVFRQSNLLTVFTG